MKLKSGERVVHRPNVHYKNNIEKLLPEILGKVESMGRDFIEVEVDLGRIIGETICIATSDADEIVFAKRPKRFGFTRFAKNHQPEACSVAVAVLKKTNNLQEYVLITAFIGHKPEPEPWDERYFSQQANPTEAREQSRKFWKTHALIWGVEEVIRNTITKKCPW